MTVALSVPYDDELLYSVIARYMEQNSVQEPSKVISILFGRHIHPTKELVCGLGELARQTQEAWRLSPLEIARRHTLLPYFATYATDERRSAAYVSITGSGTPSPAIILRISYGHAPRGSFFRRGDRTSTRRWSGRVSRNINPCVRDPAWVLSSVRKASRRRT